MGGPSTRSRILKIWSTKYGLSLKPDSLAWLEELVERFNLGDASDPETVDAFKDAMERMAKSYTDDVEDYKQIVTVDALEEVYARLLAVEGAGGSDDDDNTNGTRHGGGVDGVNDGDGAEDALADPSSYIKIIDAFSMPSLTFDGEKKVFIHKGQSSSSLVSKSGAASSASSSAAAAARKKASLAGAPDSKAQYLRDRYNILKQVILRNEHFSPPALPGHDRENYMKLTSIKNLLGRQGGHFLLFGMITRTEDGSLSLEDLDAQVELDLSQAVPASGMFTEGCFALVDGLYTKDSIFKVREIGHPPSEKREVSRQIYGHVDFVGTGALTISEEAKMRASERRVPDQFLVFSDLHLDSQKDLSNFRNVLQAYESHLDERPPALCVLCGNFTSKPVNLTDAKEVRDYQGYFSSFADLLLSYPRCARDMHFVFVPGPSDPYDVSNLLLPRRPLPNYLVKDVKLKLPRVSFTSNPCRIIYKSQEIVVFREDLMSRMLRNTVRLKDDLSALANGQLEEQLAQQDVADLGEGAIAEGRKRVLAQFLVQTILDQSHLSPLTLQVRPLLWEFDQCLRLFPLPTSLILADKYLPYEVTYEDCHVFNPGGFAGTDYAWSVYHTATRESEQSGFQQH